MSVGSLSAGNIFSTNMSVGSLSAGNIFSTNVSAGTLNATNVGINTGSPIYELDTNGSGRYNGTVYVGSTGGNDNISLSFGSNNNTGYQLGFVKKSGNQPTIVMSNNNNMTFQVASSVDISNVSSNTYSNLMQLTTIGDLTVIGDIIGFGSISDVRLKENILNITTGLTVVNNLRPVTFDWKQDIFKESKRGLSDSGFIAQEVERIIPHAVSEYFELNSNNKYKNMKHERIIPYLVSAIQELYTILQKNNIN
jgi:hypothetical protein